MIQAGVKRGELKAQMDDIGRKLSSAENLIDQWKRDLDSIEKRLESERR